MSGNSTKAYASSLFCPRPVDLTWCVFPSHAEGSGSRVKECSAAVSDPKKQELNIKVTHNHGTVQSAFISDSYVA